MKHHISSDWGRKGNAKDFGFLQCCICCKLCFHFIFLKFTIPKIKIGGVRTGFFSLTVRNGSFFELDYSVRSIF